LVQAIEEWLRDNEVWFTAGSSLFSAVALIAVLVPAISRRWPLVRRLGSATLWVIAVPVLVFGLVRIWPWPDLPLWTLPLAMSIWPICVYGPLLCAQAAWWLSSRGLWFPSIPIPWYVRAEERKPGLFPWKQRAPLPLDWVRVQFKVSRVSKVVPGINVLDSQGGTVVRLALPSYGEPFVWIPEPGDPHRTRLFERECAPGEWHTLHMKRVHGGVVCIVDGECIEVDEVRWPHEVRVWVGLHADKDASSTVYMRGPWFGY